VGIVDRFDDSQADKHRGRGDRGHQHERDNERDGVDQCEDDQAGPTDADGQIPEPPPEDVATGQMVGCRQSRTDW
jgi:hypothetical protein